MHRHPGTLAIAVADQQPIFEVAIPCQIFGSRPPGYDGPWYDVMLCAEDGRESRLRGSATHTDMAAAFSVHATHDFADLRTANTVLVPACPNAAEPPPVSLVDAVRDAHRAGARIISLCSGAFVLAAAGILDGRVATMHWKHAPMFAGAHPDVPIDPSVLFVDHGDVMTGAGNTAGIDLCLHVLRSDLGSDVANSVARQLIVPPQRVGGQAQFVEPPAVPATSGTGVGELLAWASEHLDEPLSLDDLAARMHTSRRTFIRRFTAEVGTTPLRWLLSQRVARARHLLEETELSVDLIAEHSGLGSAANLRTHFTRAVGVSPRDYRRHHQPQSPPTATTADMALDAKVAPRSASEHRSKSDVGLVSNQIAL